MAATHTLSRLLFCLLSVCFRSLAAPVPSDDTALERLEFGLKQRGHRIEADLRQALVHVSQGPLPDTKKLEIADNVRTLCDGLGQLKNAEGEERQQLLRRFGSQSQLLTKQLQQHKRAVRTKDGLEQLLLEVWARTEIGQRSQQTIANTISSISADLDRIHAAEPQEQPQIADDIETHMGLLREQMAEHAPWSLPDGAAAEFAGSAAASAGGEGNGLEKEREEKEHNVHHLLQELLVEVRTRKDLSQAEKKAATKEIYTMNNELLEYHNAPPESRTAIIQEMKTNLKKLRSHMDEAHDTLMQPPPLAVSGEDLERVETQKRQKVEGILEQFSLELESRTEMTDAEKERVRDNVQSMHEDLKLMATATPTHKAELLQALRLRMNALRQEMQEPAPEAQQQAASPNLVRPASKVIWKRPPVADNPKVRSVSALLQEALAEAKEKGLSGRPMEEVTQTAEEMYQVLDHIRASDTPSHRHELVLSLQHKMNSLKQYLR